MGMPAVVRYVSVHSHSYCVSTKVGVRRKRATPAFDHRETARNAGPQSREAYKWHAAISSAMNARSPIVLRVHRVTFKSLQSANLLKKRRAHADGLGWPIASVRPSRNWLPQEGLDWSPIQVAARGVKWLRVGCTGDKPTRSLPRGAFPSTHGVRRNYKRTTHATAPCEDCDVAHGLGGRRIADRLSVAPLGSHPGYLPFLRVNLAPRKGYHFPSIDIALFSGPSGGRIRPATPANSCDGCDSWRGRQPVLSADITQELEARGMMPHPRLFAKLLAQAFPMDHSQAISGLTGSGP